MKAPEISRLSDLGLFLKIGLWSIVIPPILRALSVPGAYKVITPRRRNVPADLRKRAMGVEKSIQYGEFWVGVLRRLIGATCYQRTAILYRCLRDQGIPVKIAIGLRDRNPLLGHSWLILHGKPFLEPRKDLKKFKMSYVYP